MSFFFPIIFSVHGMAMLFDEFYYHRKRGLPLWERIGHPLDTLSVLLCYSYLGLTGSSQFSFEVYLGLAGFSCFLVTKDEWIHKEECQSSEHWLHALLFILHPVMLYGAFRCALENELFVYFQILFLATTVMFLYQVLYWNFLIPESRRGKLHD